MLKLSPSKISTYKQCPFKYKCEIDTQIRKAYKQDTPDLVFGNLIHACLNDFFKRIDESQHNLETLEKLFEQKFRANWDRHVFVFKTKQNIIKYVEESKRQFSIFINSEYRSGNPFLIEEFPKLQFSEELELGGKFDRVDLNDNELTLIDYKTGKLKEENKNEIQFQLDFYEYLLNKLYPQYKVGKKVIFFLREEKPLEYKNPIDMNKVEKEIIEIFDQIRNDFELKPIRNSLCKFCDYQSLCPLMNDNNE